MPRKGRRSKTSRRASAAPQIPLQEHLLIEALAECEGNRVLCTSIARGQFAAAAHERLAEARVTCHFLDVWQAELTRNEVPGEVSVLCTADVPTDEVDIAAFPVKSTGDAELTRDILQSGHLALRMGGRMLAATDNSRDTWLHDELRKLFPKVTRRPQDRGVLYLATKTEPLRKVKNFEAEFAFRDEGRLIHAFSRPSVFSHRRLDLGARTLINAMEIRPGMRVLDIGCGSGVVGFAAALRSENVSVLAVDSNARAIDCTIRGAIRNNLTNVETLLNASGECGEPRTFDLVLGNPPYFSNYRIAEIFLEAARRALKPGGEVLMVTKTPNWFLEHMPRYFQHVEERPAKNYSIVAGRQK